MDGAWIAAGIGGGIGLLWHILRNARSVHAQAAQGEDPAAGPVSQTLLSRVPQRDLDIRYAGSEAPRTLRRITLNHVQGERGTKGQVVFTRIEAYCHLRKAPRTFIVDKISSAVDPDTGEILSSKKDVQNWLRQVSGAV